MTPSFTIEGLTYSLYSDRGREAKKWSAIFSAESRAVWSALAATALAAVTITTQIYA